MNVQMLVIIGLVAIVMYGLCKIIEWTYNKTVVIGYILREYGKQKKIEKENKKKTWIIAGYRPETKA